MSWLTIKINPPKLDVKIVARTGDEFGYGYSAEIFEFDSSNFTEEEAEMYLQNRSYIEWLELPKWKFTYK